MRDKEYERILQIKEGTLDDFITESSAHASLTLGSCVPNGEAGYGRDSSFGLHNTVMYAIP